MGTSRAMIALIESLLHPIQNVNFNYMTGSAGPNRPGTIRGLPHRGRAVAT